MTKEINLTNDRVALVSDEDYSILNRWLWCSPNAKVPYAVRAVRDSETRKQRLIYMHKFVALELMNLRQNTNQVIDHKDRNSLNNQRDNLIVASVGQNSFNRKTNTNNSSGVRGVGYVRKTNRWHAFIYYHNERINLGYYKEFEDAVKARYIAEEKLHPEYFEGKF
jgi:hypothetical protein